MEGLPAGTLPSLPRQKDSTAMLPSQGSRASRLFQEEGRHWPKAKAPDIPVPELR